MVNLYTIVGSAYACNGRKTRAEAIAEAKAHYLHARDSAVANLAAIEAGIVVVFVQRGWHRPTVIGVLTDHKET